MPVLDPIAQRDHYKQFTATARELLGRLQTRPKAGNAGDTTTCVDPGHSGLRLGRSDWLTWMDVSSDLVSSAICQVARCSFDPI